MSSYALYVNKRSSIEKRNKDDAYYTPENVAKACTHFVEMRYKINQRALDIGCGEGIFGKTLFHRSKLLFNEYHITGIDINFENHKHQNIIDFYKEAYFGASFLDLPKPEHKYDLVIGNPPYGAFQEIFEYAWNDWLSDSGEIIWLLPLKYMQGDKRYKRIFSDGHLKSVNPFVDRIPFKGNQPFDQHALFVWSKSYKYPSFSGSWIQFEKEKKLRKKKVKA